MRGVGVAEALDDLVMHEVDEVGGFAGIDVGRSEADGFGEVHGAFITTLPDRRKSVRAASCPLVAKRPGMWSLPGNMGGRLRGYPAN